MKAQQNLVRYYSKWITISALVGVFCGLASAIFLATLEATTRFREAHPWLLFLLPLGGLIVGSIYHVFGNSVEGGNNLIIDEFHDPTSVIPFRMAPLVLLGTIFTHLFGGSAGREGTAVQMGGSIADQFTHVFKMGRAERRTLLMAGMSGGFASVFGVPIAGTLFGLEVLAVGRLHLWGVIECAVAAFVAHYTTLGLGIHHTDYLHPAATSYANLNGLHAILAGLIFGLAARLFAICADQIKVHCKKIAPLLPVRAIIGGGIISLTFFLIPEATRYAGLGIPIIVDSLNRPLPLYDWFGKLTYTAFTLGTGFKGGEVTPLLFVGATLGNALSSFLPLPLPTLAAMGFVGVFAGAANTPFACTAMAIELFGADVGVWAALACFASYAVSGHHGIYHAQQIHIPNSNLVSRAREFIGLLFKRPPLPERKKRE
ncbi:MAG: voltage-gated chloride channel protein [Bdellovibrio sp.]|nr:MAG: voltage-gated chloride channel protein [Bdellovibrio sp.]